MLLGCAGEAHRQLKPSAQAGSPPTAASPSACAWPGAACLSIPGYRLHNPGGREADTPAVNAPGGQDSGPRLLLSGWHTGAPGPAGGAEAGAPLRVPSVGSRGTETPKAALRPPQHPPGQSRNEPGATPPAEGPPGPGTPRPPDGPG